MIKEKITLQELTDLFEEGVERVKKSTSMIESADEVKDSLLNKIEKVYEKFSETNKYSDLERGIANEIITEIDEVNSGWSYVASYISSHISRIEQEETVKSYLNLDDSKDYVGWVRNLVDKNLLDKEVFDSYSNEDISRAYSVIKEENDYLFTSIGLHTMLDRYCLRGFGGELLETPQMRWVTIGLAIHQKEDPYVRVELVHETYWALSNLYMTVATPTLANAGKPNAQLSSCFIDTVEDSLDDIYNSNTDVANLSKHGGGIGVYMGKVRARGSDIRGFKGASSGINDYSPLTLRSVG